MAVSNHNSFDLAYLRLRSAGAAKEDLLGDARSLTRAVLPVDKLPETQSENEAQPSNPLPPIHVWHPGPSV